MYDPLPMFVPILLAVVEIFLFFAVGWTANRLNYIRDTEIDRWSRFALDFLFPPFIFSTIVADFEVDRIGELWPLPVIGYGMMAFGAAAGFLLRHGLRSNDRDTSRTFHHFCAVNNYGYLPIIIIARLWGDPGIAKLFFLNLGSHLGFWTLGPALLGRTSFRSNIKAALNPAVISIGLALFVSLTGLRDLIPEFLLAIVGQIGTAAVPVALIIIGAAMHGVPIHHDPWDIAYLSAVRLVVLPAALMGLLWLLPLSHDVFQISIVVAAMPVAVTSTLLTRKFGGSPAFAARAAIITTILAAVTVPLAVLLFLG